MMLPLASDDQGDRWLNAQPSAQPMLGPRGLLPKASCRVPSDRGPDQPLPPALTPHPPCSLLLVPQAQWGLPFWFFLIPGPFLGPRPSPPGPPLPSALSSQVTSLQVLGVCVCVTITPGGPPGKREVEVAGMRENRLMPPP